MTGTARIIRADARHLPLADDSVDLVVTSPPYFALRSYTDNGEHYDGQIGAEATPDEFVTSLLEVTAECVRVLKPTGSLWVNLGDKYAGSGGGGVGSSDGETGRGPRPARPARFNVGIPTKSLIGIPWRYALRCIDDLGLILRAEVIWSKPNGLPESVTDRVRRSHEQWFMFTLQPRYFSAVDEIREGYTAPPFRGQKKHKAGDSGATANPVLASLTSWDASEYQHNPLGKLPSSVWEISDDSNIVRSVLSAISTGSLTIEEGERILRGSAAWTGSNGSGARSTRAATAGSGQADSRRPDTASSGSTERPNSRTASPTPSPPDECPTGHCTSTTCAECATASATSSPSPFGTTSYEDPQPSQPSTPPRPTAPTGTSSTTPTPTGHRTEAACVDHACEPETEPATGRPAQPSNAPPGSVWTIPTEPLRVPESLGVDHFAAFPTEFPRRIIAGWSPAGVCTACGEGLRPRAVKEGGRPVARAHRHLPGYSDPAGEGMRDMTYRIEGYECTCRHWTPQDIASARTTAPTTATTEVLCAAAADWQQATTPDATATDPCGSNTASDAGACSAPEPSSGAFVPEPAPALRSAVVLDPFGGTGTTALVAKALGRHGISVDMSADYCRLASWRVNDPGELAKAARVDKPAKQVDGQGSLLDLFEGEGA